MDKETEEYLNSLSAEDRESLEFDMDMEGCATIAEWRSVQKGIAYYHDQNHVDRVVQVIEAGESPGPEQTAQALRSIADWADDETPIPAPPLLLEYAAALLTKSTEEFFGKENRGRNSPYSVKAQLLPTTNEERQAHVNRMFGGPDKIQRKKEFHADIYHKFIAQLETNGGKIREARKEIQKDTGLSMRQIQRLTPKP